MSTSAKSPRVGIVITAAGSGTRLGYGIPKALVPLVESAAIGDEESASLSHSLFAVALRNAAGIAGVERIVVTAPRQYIEQFESAVEKMDLDVTVLVVEGSVTRQSSVFEGLKALEASGFGDDPHCVVLVHDAARAMASSMMMNRVVDAVVQGCSAVIPTLVVSDTLKLVDPTILPDPETGTQRIVGSADRTAMRTVQTPQGFSWPVLMGAHRQFEAQGVDESTAATDDSSLAQWAGFDVHCVQGDVLALKVTTPTDLALARILYAQTLEQDVSS